MISLFLLLGVLLGAFLGSQRHLSHSQVDINLTRKLSHMRRITPTVPGRHAVQPSRAAPFLASRFPFSRTFSSGSFGGEVAMLYQKVFEEGAPAWDTTAAAVQSVDSKASSILDLAAGPGEPACRLSEVFPDAKVFCTDSSPDMVKMAQARAEKLGRDNVICAVADMNDLSVVESGSQDVVTANFGLMFTPDVPGALQEIHRVLRPGGYLVGTVWQEFEILPVLKQTMTTLLGHEPPPNPVNPLSLADPVPLDAALEGAGFEFAKGHRETFDINLSFGPSTEDSSFKAILIPVLAKLSEMQNESADGDDVIGKAVAIVKQVAAKRIDNEGNVSLSGVYRNVVVQKPS